MLITRQHPRCSDGEHFYAIHHFYRQSVTKVWLKCSQNVNFNQLKGDVEEELSPRSRSFIGFTTTKTVHCVLQPPARSIVLLLVRFYFVAKGLVLFVTRYLGEDT